MTEGIGQGIKDGAVIRPACEMFCSFKRCLAPPRPLSPTSLEQGVRLEGFLLEEISNQAELMAPDREGRG